MKIKNLRQIGIVILAVALLFVLPNKGYGPYAFFNPYVVWFMVIFVLGISVVSYFAVGFFGAKRGIGLTGFFAGLISSTALVLSFSGESKRNRGVVNPYAFAVVLASSAMFFRILVEVAVLNRELLFEVGIPMGAMGITGMICAFFLWFKDDCKGREGVKKEISKIKNPFRLMPALQFGVAFALVLFVSEAAMDMFGNSGLYLTSVASGLVDVDAITVSVANLTRNGVDISTGVAAISLAAMTNTVVKGGMFLLLGNWAVAVRILACFSVMLVVGGGVLLLF